MKYLSEINFNGSGDDYLWWKDEVVYQIYPRSFYDSNNDGTGDIRGIIEKIDYLEYMGYGAVWLSPINRSPMDDFGYDIKDYRRIESVFGTEADFDELIEKLHARGIKIIFDLVMNHTSDTHLWFVESRSSKMNPKRDWYIWQPKKGWGYPNNWRAAFGGRAWEMDKVTGEYYLHSFLKQQPDLNWRSESLMKAVFSDIKFWLDRGIDGFRLDVVNWFIKDEHLRNNPYHIGYAPRAYDMQRHIYDRNRPETHDILKKFRALLNEYPDRMSVGEVFSAPPGDQKLSASFVGQSDDELNMAFDFSLMYVKWDAALFTRKLSEWFSFFGKSGWPCNVFNNHDQPRAASRFHKKGLTDRRMRILAMLLLTLPGTPFVYYGEEIGMCNGSLSRSQLRDPLGKKYWPFFKGRDPERTPFQWDSRSHASFSSHAPWLPVNCDYNTRNVSAQMNDASSLLHLYRRLVFMRKDKKVLRRGGIKFLSDGTCGVLSFERFFDGDRLIVALNFKSVPVSFDVQSGFEIIVSSAGRCFYDGRLDAMEGVIFQLKSS